VHEKEMKICWEVGSSLGSKRKGRATRQAGGVLNMFFSCTVLGEEERNEAFFSSKGVNSWCRKSSQGSYKVNFYDAWGEVRIEGGVSYPLRVHRGGRNGRASRRR